LSESCSKTAGDVEVNTIHQNPASLWFFLPVVDTQPRLAGVGLPAIGDWFVRALSILEFGDLKPALDDPPPWEHL
jgi:hypothetical protein